MSKGYPIGSQCVITWNQPGERTEDTPPIGTIVTIRGEVFPWRSGWITADGFKMPPGYEKYNGTLMQDTDWQEEDGFKHTWPVDWMRPWPPEDKDIDQEEEKPVNEELTA